MLLYGTLSFVWNQFFRLLRQLLRCDVALASPMITSMARRPYVSTHSEPVECSVHVKTRSLALERSSSRVEWLMNDDGEVKALRSLVMQPAMDHPAAFHWHASSKKNRPSWCLFPFRMATVLPLRTAWMADILSQASLRDAQRQRCWKRGSGDGQRLSLWDYGTTERSFNAIERRGSTLTWTVCTAADSEERQICTACLFAESVGLWKDDGLMLSPIVCDVQRQGCWKRGSGDGQRLSLWDYGTTERSFDVVERRGSTLTCTVCTAANSEERQICTTCLALNCEKTTVLCFLPLWSTLLFDMGLGEEGRFDVASRSETPKPSCHSHKQQLLRLRSGPSKAAHTRTTGVKEQHVPSKYRKKKSN